jgi:hypothetical protein
MNSSLTNNYPIIQDTLIEALRNTFPNTLPEHYISDFDLGVLVGEQKVINKLIAEKEYNETQHIDEYDMDDEE